MIGKPGIWFLKKESQATWSIMPVLEGAIPIDISFITVPAGPLSYDPDATPVDKLVAEIAAAAQEPSTASEAARHIGLGALNDLDPTKVRRLWDALAQSSSGPSKAIGLAQLIQAGDRAALLAVANGDVQIDPGQPNFLAMSINQYRDSDPAAISALAKVAQGQEPLRSAAAHALRAIHTEDTLPYLAALLDSDSAIVRYEGVAGIASFANGLPVQTDQNYTNMAFLKPSATAEFQPTDETREHFPGLDLFRENEQKYILFWKKWLADNQLAKP
jgi:hypothetical protein